MLSPNPSSPVLRRDAPPLNWGPLDITRLTLKKKLGKSKADFEGSILTGPKKGYNLELVLVYKTLHKKKIKLGRALIGLDWT